MSTRLQHLPSEIIRFHILPFTSGLAQDLIPLFNSCSLLRSKFKEFYMIFSCEGRKCFQTSKFVRDASIVEMDCSLELNERFVAILESGLFERVHLDFKWTNLSEWMVTLLTRELKCLNSISQIQVHETSGNVESMLLNANWKQLSVLKFFTKVSFTPPYYSVRGLMSPKTIPKKQIVDISKITKLEKFEMNDNIRFKIPKNNTESSNLKELKLARHDSSFFTKLFKKWKFPKLECLEISNCDLRTFDFSAVKSFQLKSLSLPKCKLNSKQFVKLFKYRNLSNLESLRITLEIATILEELFESSIFNKTLSTLVIEKREHDHEWDTTAIWDCFLNGNLKNIKHLTVQWMSLNGNNIQALIESNIQLEGLVVYNINDYKEGDFKQCFRNLTELRIIGTIYDITFPFNEMQQLKHLAFKCSPEILPLNLPKLESIEGKGFRFEKNSTTNLKHITCSGSIYSIVNSIIENPMNLETFHFRSWHDHDKRIKDDDAVHTIATHSNFANLKELEIGYLLDDHSIGHLVNSQFKLNSLIINSIYLTASSVYEICDGSIEAKMIQLMFCDGYFKDPLFYRGSLNGLIQLLTDLDNQECTADIIIDENLLYDSFDYFYDFLPESLDNKFLTYEDYCGRGIVSEFTFDDSTPKKRRIKSDFRKYWKFSDRYW